MNDVDLGAVRAFVAVAEEGYFGEAAVRLGISQQAVSKRIARLEADLGLRLLLRSRAGAALTDDGRAFLPHARALTGLADQALAALRGRRGALRIDVLDTRLAPIDLVRAFHESEEGAEVEIVTSDGLRSARAALARGSVDAALCRVDGEPEEDLVAVPALLEPLHLLAGRGHPLAGLPRVEMARLAGATVWMPGNAPGSEWADYYRLLAEAFAVRIDASGPDFGYEHLAAEVGAGGLLSFVGEGTRIPWRPDIVQIPLVEPVPVYPHSLLRHRQNPHPLLPRLLAFVTRARPSFDPRRQWLPAPDRAAFTAAAR
ncbi:LysR family transcriptional regulator [Bailinhaonella thermotolerans]|uniref:LysR family transcriptional regulator n=1 Tax=Bailinhaonella thermotolerans TaxID=1070861 RepID=UPI00192A31B1|nr:LysR family transcriptional regulator [Bailinhaonella thermotolerans]